MDLTGEKMFEIGDIVKVVKPFWTKEGDIQGYVGKLAAIESYANPECDEDKRSEYGIIFLENGNESAWWDEDKLEFVRKGESGIIDKLHHEYDEWVKQHSQLNYIINHYPAEMGTCSYLTLFEEIGYYTPFIHNGEYFCLYNDIFITRPIFDAIIIDHDLNTAIKYIDDNFDGGDRKEVFKQKVQNFYQKIINDL